MAEWLAKWPTYTPVPLRFAGVLHLELSQRAWKADGSGKRFSRRDL